MSEPKTAEVKVVPVEPTEAMIEAMDQAIFTHGNVVDAYRAMLAASPPAETGEGEADHIGDATTMIATHPDDLAVDRFAAAMKVKLAKKRADGRGGWEDKSECSAEFLSGLLRGHVEKGDPLDVGNLAMMLHQRGEGITAQPVSPSEGEREEARVFAQNKSETESASPVNTGSGGQTAQVLASTGGPR